MDRVKTNKQKTLHFMLQMSAKRTRPRGIHYRSTPPEMSELYARFFVCVCVFGLHNVQRRKYSENHRRHHRAPHPHVTCHCDRFQIVLWRLMNIYTTLLYCRAGQERPGNA